MEIYKLYIQYLFAIRVPCARRIKRQWYVCSRVRAHRGGWRCRCWWRTGSRAGAAAAAGTRVAAAGPARPWRARRRTWRRPRVPTAPITRPPPRCPITRSSPASATWWVRARACSTARTRGPARSRACSSNSSHSAARIYHCRAEPGSARHPRRGPRPTPIPPSRAHGPSPRIQLPGTPYPTTVLKGREGNGGICGSVRRIGLRARSRVAERTARDELEAFAARGSFEVARATAVSFSLYVSALRKDARVWCCAPMAYRKDNIFPSSFSRERIRMVYRLGARLRNVTLRQSTIDGYMLGDCRDY